MKRLRLLAALLALAGAVSPPLCFAGGDATRTPLPKIHIANPGQCVAPPAEMRRNHMEMLKHQRDRTMRAGVRGEAHSLNACIECHATKTTGTVLGEGGFCQSCHSYAAVKLDCFECHQPNAARKTAAATPTAEVKP